VGGLVSHKRTQALACNSIPDEFLRETLEGVTETEDRIAEAEAVMPAQATGNYSYLSDRMCGPGYLLIGDAIAFIDPVFSSGVYLAMNSAERAIAVAEAGLTGNSGEYRRACRRYDFFGYYTEANKRTGFIPYQSKQLPVASCLL
jgi:flavin-dependent dehydrogenase